MENRSIIIDVNSDVQLKLKVSLFEEEEDIDIDSIIKLRLDNLAAELVTTPLLLNRFGILLAEMESKVNLSKLKLEVEESTIADAIREKYREENQKELSNEKTSEQTRKHPKYKMYKTLHIKAIEQRDIINSIFWAIKAKDAKLDKLSMTLQAGDVQEQLANSKLKRFNYVNMSR